MDTIVRLKSTILPPDTFTIHRPSLKNIPKIGNSVIEILDIYLEIISENGKLFFNQISSIDREIAHEKWLLHISAHVWIFNSKGEVLLQKRSLKKSSSPWKWDISAAGHVESGETVIYWAIREIQEELWITVSENNLNLIAGFRNEVKRVLNWKMYHNNEIASVFLMRFDGNISDLSFDDDEVEGFKFVPLAELERDWNDDERLKLYASKGEEYRRVILTNLQKVCR